MGGGKAQLTGRFLLQGGGDEGGSGVAADLLFANVGDGIAAGFQIGDPRYGLGFGLDGEFFHLFAVKDL